MFSTSTPVSLHTRDSILTWDLLVDGAGGERIVRIYYSIYCAIFRTRHAVPRPGWIRFVTNRGRQLIVGAPVSPLGRFYERVLPPTTAATVRSQPAPERFLAGFYGWWSPAALASGLPTNVDWEWLDAMGVFLSPELKSASIPADPWFENDLEDGKEGYDWWEPGPPPPWYVESGDVIGKLPYHRNCVSWIELQRPFRRPLTLVRCRPGLGSGLPPLVAGFICSYLDDDTENEELVARGGTGRYPGFAGLTLLNGWLGQADCELHKYRLESGPQSYRLISIRLWLAKSSLYFDDGTLVGMQFVYDTHTDSACGICEGPCTTIMSLDGRDGDEKAIGLKLFFAPVQTYRLAQGFPNTCVRVPYTPRSVLVGIQAMVLDES